jgi:hypothetical protein
MSLLSSNRGNGKSLLDNGGHHIGALIFPIYKIFVHFSSPLYKIT